MSIEEYLGRNTDAYYAALRQVQGGRHQPGRDAAPWIRFCVEAHLDQVQRRLEQIAAVGTPWSLDAGLVVQTGRARATRYVAAETLRRLVAQG